MSYATKADMVLRFGAQELIQITDRERIGDIDDSVLDRAIADAEAEINASLQDRYALPLTTVPPLVTRIACQLIRYFLYDNGAPENVSVSATEARAVLKGIAAGTLRLGLDAAGAAPVPATALTIDSTRTDKDRVFTGVSLADFG